MPTAGTFESARDRFFQPSREPCGYCGSRDDVRTGLGDYPKCVECRMRSGQEPLANLVVEGLLYQISTLQGLLKVEVDGARSIMDGAGGSGDMYCAGRIGAYDLVLRAIDDRWGPLIG